MTHPRRARKTDKTLAYSTWTLLAHITLKSDKGCHIVSTSYMSVLLTGVACYTLLLTMYTQQHAFSRACRLLLQVDFGLSELM